MTSRSRSKTCFLLQLCCALLLTCTLPLTGNTAPAETAMTVADKQDDRIPPVTMTLENISISKAATLIGEQTGYRIILQGLASDLPVSGRFTEVDLSTVFTSLLRDYNLAILVDYNERQITVQSLGKKLPSRGQDNLPIFSDRKASQDDQNQDAIEESVANSNMNTENDRDPLTGQTFAEIASLHRIQKEEIERKQQDPETVDPFTGMTNAEIWALHEKQRKEIADTQP